MSCSWRNLCRLSSSELWGEGGRQGGREGGKEGGREGEREGEREGGG